MREFFNSEIFILALTFSAYFGAQKLQDKTGIILLNPILIAIITIIGILKLLSIDYSVYHQNSRLIEFFLKPAVVALGIPLYQQLEKIKKHALSIIFSQLAGCIAGVVSVVIIAKLMGASKEIILSLVPKSITTPIAMEVSKAIGGIPPLTASVVVVVGIFGGIFGHTIMKWTRVKNPIAQGLSMGTAAHGLGTSISMAISPSYGALASIGLIMNGIFTAILAPTILQLLSFWIDI